MIKKAFFIICWLCLLAGPAHAAELSIACAANFTAPMKELAALYEQQTGAPVTCAFGSTGMLYGQITNGAPFDLFFAADEHRPALLHAAGLALPPVLYARGRVVLWTRDRTLTSLTGWKAVVTSPVVKRIGLANPKTAPYGEAAREALAAAGLMEAAQPRLAYGKNVGMTFQFAYSGAADIAFVALSQALSAEGSSGTHWPVPEAHPVRQAVCVVAGKDEAGAAAFLAWMRTAPARTIIMRYGYEHS